MSNPEQIYFPITLDPFEPVIVRRRGKRWAGRSKRVVLVLPEAVCDIVDNRAAHYGVSRNQYIRMAIELRLFAEVNPRKKAT